MLWEGGGGGGGGGGSLKSCVFRSYYIIYICLKIIVPLIS